MLDQAGSTWSSQLALTDKGRKFIIDEGKKALDSCAKKKELAPQGCPMAIQASGGQEVNTDSISRTIKGDPWGGDIDVTYAPDTASLQIEADWDFRPVAP